MAKNRYTFAFFKGARSIRSFEVTAENPLDAVQQAFTDTIVQNMEDKEGSRMEMYCHGEKATFSGDKDGLHGQSDPA
jgi:hypothetical protein